MAVVDQRDCILVDNDTIEFMDTVFDLSGIDQYSETAVTDMGEIRFKSKNLDAERRRRGKLNSKLLILRSIVPKITKMSKESTLLDAIDYIQELQKEVSDLHSELSRLPAEEILEKKGSTNSITEKPLDPESITCQAQVTFAPMGSCKYQLKMVCVNRFGQFSRILEALNAFNAEVVNTSMVSSFGYSEASFIVVAKDEKQEILTELVGLLSALVEVKNG
ncbi:basic helix-loop-helix (bHLH) DNA-binding superfamily protein [Rhynchospora pubera]|uniref:Basic helix-loop-helix (BHLH) DNA-binding superfamily protein n=1 Tax=Rhynchospora pubera TaxID=906938 RepID=A0AAV8BQL0_9POAL|nr:basic helix-loop-helix (bHLH) DNA-binding superfamily protein [Rhynchospora pubera]